MTFVVIGALRVNSSLLPQWQEMYKVGNLCKNVMVSYFGSFSTSVHLKMTHCEVMNISTNSLGLEFEALL